MLSLSYQPSSFTFLDFMSAVHHNNTNTTPTTTIETQHNSDNYDSPDDLYQDPDDIDFPDLLPSHSPLPNNNKNNDQRKNLSRNDTTDDDDIYDDPEVADQFYRDPNSVSFHVKSVNPHVSGDGGDWRHAADDIDDGAYHDPDTDGGFHVLPPMATRPVSVNHVNTNDDDDDDLYQDPEEIDFRGFVVASHRNDIVNTRYRDDHDSPDEDYCEPPPDARVPVVPVHHRPTDRGTYSMDDI